MRDAMGFLPVCILIQQNIETNITAILEGGQPCAYGEIGKIKARAQQLSAHAFYIKVHPARLKESCRESQDVPPSSSISPIRQPGYLHQRVKTR